MVQPMNDKKYEQLEINNGGIRMILEFPKESNNIEETNREVKDILSSLLEETIHKSHYIDGDNSPIETKEGGRTI